MLKQNIEILLKQFISFSLASKDNVTALVLEFQQDFCQLIVKLVKKNKNTICSINTFILHAGILLHTDPAIGVVLLQYPEPVIPVRFVFTFYFTFQNQNLSAAVACHYNNTEFCGGLCVCV